MKQLPSYQEILTALGDEVSSTLPAECHGYICGVICSGHGTESSHFKLIFDLLAEENLLTTSIKELVKQLTLLTLSQLQQTEFTFQLLLPDDEQPVKVKCEALANFCEHFLEGLGIAGIEQTNIDHAHLKEVLHDLAEIAQLSSDDKTTDETEFAYTEIVEYVRAAVWLIYMETANIKDKETVH